jgi:ribonuclease P protein component
MPRRHLAVEAMARLVESADFERVLRSASRASTQHFAVHHLPGHSGTPAPASPRPLKPELSTMVAQIGARPVDDSPLQACARHLGAVVPKRHARRSVTRSLLKRQIYAAGDRHVASLAFGLWIVRLRAPFDRSTFPSAASLALRVAARTELESLFCAAAQARPS